MTQHREIGEEITTVQWGIVVDDGYGPEVLMRADDDREAAERLLAGVKNRSTKPEDVQLVVRTVVTSAWTTVAER